jgi:hypothetical protein
MAGLGWKTCEEIHVTIGSTQCGWGRPCRCTMYGSGVRERIECSLWQPWWGWPKTHRG